MSAVTRGGNLVEEVCRDFPHTPTLTLAKKLYKEHPKVFPSLEGTRTLIRYRRGQAGGELRNKRPDKSLFTNPGKYCPFNLPASEAKPRVPVKLEGSRFLMLYDLHIPYHDEQALALAIGEGKKRKCDAVFLGGDILDCYQLSSFVQDPEMRHFGEELGLARSFLGYIRNQFPKAMLYFKEGNHEERYWKYMRVKAPELLGVKPCKELGVPELSMQFLLGLPALGYEWINGRTKANIGKLSVLHGHEFGKSMFSPVNQARGLCLRARSSAIAGHGHATSEHSEKDLNAKAQAWWSVGCLCELSPEYSPYNRWNHGFAIIDHQGESFHVDNIRIYNGVIL